MGASQSSINAIDAISGTFPPLTTAFTQPSSCFTGSLVGDTDTGGFPVVRHTEMYDYENCYPAGMLAALGTYSPGLCPVSYTTAFLATASSVTIAECCPSDYFGFGGTKSGVVPTCVSFFNTPLLVECYGAGTSCTPTYLESGFVEALAITVLFQEQDIPLFPPSYTSPGVSLAATTSTSSNTSTRSTSPSSSLLEKAATGLAVGAKIGIGVGVGFGIQLLLALVGAFFFVKRRRKTANTISAVPDVYSKAELEAHSKEPDELGDIVRGELQASEDRDPNELEVSSSTVCMKPVEMEA